MYDDSSQRPESLSLSLPLAQILSFLLSECSLWIYKHTNPDFQSSPHVLLLNMNVLLKNEVFYITCVNH